MKSSNNKHPGDIAQRYCSRRPTTSTPAEKSWPLHARRLSISILHQRSFVARKHPATASSPSLKVCQGQREAAERPQPRAGDFDGTATSTPSPAVSLFLLLEHPHPRLRFIIDKQKNEMGIIPCFIRSLCVCVCLSVSSKSHLSTTPAAVNAMTSIKVSTAVAAAAPPPFLPSCLEAAVPLSTTDAGTMHVVARSGNRSREGEGGPMGRERRETTTKPKPRA